MTTSYYVPDDDTRIWRYIRLNSFLELMTGNLVQVRIDAFNDPTEGSYGLREVTIEPTALQAAGIKVESTATWREDVLREARLHALATCWFEYRTESFAMWNVYGRLGESVAIESTVGALRDALGQGGELRTTFEQGGAIRIERMRYTPATGAISDLRELFFHKRPEFEYEQEIRSLWMLPHRVGGRVHNTGLLLQDLNKFIRKIIVAPGNRAIFPGAICSIVNAMFNVGSLRFEGEIVPSALDEYIVT